MQNLGFADAISPALEELYPDAGERARAVSRHLEFFNCHPYLAAAILGGAVNLEERVATGTVPAETVSGFKRALGPPFAALGDGFFWLALRPAAALIAAVLEPSLGLWAVAVFLGLYNGVHLAARLWLFVSGYKHGEEVVKVIGTAHLASRTGLLKTFAAALAGAIAASAAILAGSFGRPWHTLFAGAAIVLATALLPRLRLVWAVYLALFFGLALGGAFF